MNSKEGKWELRRMRTIDYKNQVFEPSEWIIKTINNGIGSHVISLRYTNSEGKVYATHPMLLNAPQELRIEYKYLKRLITDLIKKATE